MTRVLLLEDDPLVLLMLSLELQADGIEVVPAETAREALDLLGQPSDLLVCDLDLRDRHDGYAVARMARARHPTMAVLYTSGMAHPDFEARSVRGGVLALKPLLDQEIVRRVRALLAC